MKNWWLIPAAIFAGYLLAPKSARASSYAVPEQGGGFAQIQALSDRVEQIAGMPGFSAFALGTAQRESRGNNLAMNDSASEAAAACRGYRANTGQRSDRYSDNPFPQDRWCFGSGGWFGQLPSTALAAPGFANSDPFLVFDPISSVVFLADFVRRVRRGFFSRIPAEHRNWLTVRRFMSSNSHGLDWREELEKSPRIRERFAADLEARGIDPSFMYQKVRITNYPGAVPLFETLSGSQPQAAPAA